MTHKMIIAVNLSVSFLGFLRAKSEIGRGQPEIYACKNYVNYRDQVVIPTKILTSIRKFWLLD